MSTWWIIQCIDDLSFQQPPDTSTIQLVCCHMEKIKNCIFIDGPISLQLPTINYLHHPPTSLLPLPGCFSTLNNSTNQPSTTSYTNQPLADVLKLQPWLSRLKGATWVYSRSGVAR
ncbi:uncharacterized protein [Apostichopus japonicus]|uniref:uncharacterized protein isoform X2 n=1 Tax=Stichopus japonicus TaxID=307972 RepID=UPI003AB1A82F